MSDERRQLPEQPIEDGRRKGDLEACAVARVRAVIESRGLSIQAVADLSGLPYGTMWGFLHGRNFRISTLDAVANGLRIPLQDLIKAA